LSRLYINEALALLQKNQDSPSALWLDTTLPTLHDHSVQWLLHGYHTINKPEVIKQVCFYFQIVDNVLTSSYSRLLHLAMQVHHLTSHLIALQATRPCNDFGMCRRTKQTSGQRFQLTNTNFQSSMVSQMQMKSQHSQTMPTPMLWMEVT
jgi:hypothetical protein